MALMSAVNNPTATRSDGVYTFSMPHPIPAYLIALTVAKYEFRPLGDRTGVYAEPNLIDDTAEEMRFLPDMLPAAERVMGPYPFERYDLVFPPKFSGGMENPELNFISQDVITGNHPAVVPPHGIIAHELSHSWFGDRMTCAEWNDLWLNEGFASWMATKALDHLHPEWKPWLGSQIDRERAMGLDALPMTHPVIQDVASGPAANARPVP